MTELSSERNWPVVDGKPVRPYALPEDPERDEAVAAEWEAFWARRVWQDATRASRVLGAVVDGSRAARRLRGELRGFGVSFYFGPGYQLALSTEDGLQFVHAAHRTWRLGIVFAYRGAS